MTDKQWKNIEYFGVKESWGDPEKMSYELIKTLDAFRRFIERPIIITCGTQGAHEPNSLHYSGDAVDIIIKRESIMGRAVDMPRLLFADFLTLVRFSFTGIGVYPEWSCEGVKIGGFHLEWASKPVIERKFWMGLGTSKQNTLYAGLTVSNIEKYLLK